MKKFIFFMCFMFITTISYGKEVTFTWVANTDSTTGYKIVMDSGHQVIADINNRETTSYTYNIEQENECHTFTIYAYNDTAKSEVGNILNWCPEPPNKVMSFIITLTPTNNPQ